MRFPDLIFIWDSQKVYLFIPDETVENEKIEINNSVDAHYNYSFSSSIDNSDTAPVLTITPGPLN